MEEKNITKITHDETRVLGKIKAMHAVGQPPFLGTDYSYIHYLKEAHIPYSRLHDVGHWFGGNMYVDIPNIFRDFDADVEDPASYDFTFTDLLLAALMENGCEPYYRLGVTIENFHEIKAYRIFPPKDPHKWARICEHIIRHYNEGWADGFHYNIQYWEIWNEPDDGFDIRENAMWKGTPEQFFELYRVTSLHLRKCFGNSIKIGAYGACNFSAIFNENTRDFMATAGEVQLSDIAKYTGIEKRILEFVNFFQRFTKMVKEENLPFDFFSWHSYYSVPNTVAQQKYVEARFDELGLSPEIHITEWRPNPYQPTRGKSEDCAKAIAMMCAMHETRANVMCYYDAQIGVSRYAGLFNKLAYPPYCEVYCAYYGFKAFGELYTMGTQIACASDSPDVYTIAATDGERNGILIANRGPETTLACDLREGAKVYLIDENHMMEEISVDKNEIPLIVDGVVYIEEPRA